MLKQMFDAIRWYDQNVSDVSRRYESLSVESVHGWLHDLLPSATALLLDVGAGTGRDAAWLASRGLETIAVESSGAMRARSATATSLAIDFRNHRPSRAYPASPDDRGEHLRP